MKVALVDQAAAVVVDAEWVVLITASRLVAVPFTVWWLMEDAVVAILLLPAATVLWAVEMLVCAMTELVVMDTCVGVCDEPLDEAVTLVFTAAIVVKLRTVALGEASDEVVVTPVSFWEDFAGTVKLVVPLRAVEEADCLVASELGLVVDEELELVGLAAAVEELWMPSSEEVTVLGDDAVGETLVITMD